MGNDVEEEAIGDDCMRNDIQYNVQNIKYDDKTYLDRALECHKLEPIQI